MSFTSTLESTWVTAPKSAVYFGFKIYIIKMWVLACSKVIYLCQGIGFKILFPTERIRVPWWNGWFQVEGKKSVRVTQEIFLFQKTSICSKTNAVMPKGIRNSLKGFLLAKRGTTWPPKRIEIKNLKKPNEYTGLKTHESIMKERERKGEKIWGEVKRKIYF